MIKAEIDEAKEKVRPAIELNVVGDPREAQPASDCRTLAGVGHLGVTQRLLHLSIEELVEESLEIQEILNLLYSGIGLKDNAEFTQSQLNGIKSPFGDTCAWILD